MEQWEKFEVLENPTQEQWFDLWVFQLMERGFIKEYVTEPNVPTFTLFPGMNKIYEEVKIGKSKNTIVEKKTVLMAPIGYTPDRIIIWDVKALGIFFYPLDYKGSDWRDCYFTPQKTPSGDYFSIIEVKGPTGNQKAYGTDFRFTQKWLWANTQQYVQKVMLAPALAKQDLRKYLWSSTFTPDRFLYTDKLATNKSKPVPYRSIPSKNGVPLWEVRDMDSFLLKRGDI